MNTTQRSHARQLAKELIANGADPSSKVAVLYYPFSSAVSEDEIMGFTRPTDADESLGEMSDWCYLLGHLAADD